MDVTTLLQQKNNWTKDDFVFFWGHTNKGQVLTKACFSQWFPANFVVDGVNYNCAEQYMMAEKAKLFGDEDVRLQILTETDQMSIKKLGRQVKGYVDEVWLEHRYDVVIRGNMAKFSQNEELKTFLQSTNQKILVEASPKDTIWGIGMDEFNKDVTNPIKWKGTNLLGFALMEVRDRLTDYHN
jgi:ribA/ribD-fused uncharacterized protein